MRVSALFQMRVMLRMFEPANSQLSESRYIANRR